MSININDIILNTAISKGFTIFTLYPIDYIKTNIQYGNKINYSNYFKFYKGINITLLTQVPYSIIVFTNYTYCKNKMQLSYPQFYNNYKISSLVIIASISDLLGSSFTSTLRANVLPLKFTFTASCIDLNSSKIMFCQSFIGLNIRKNYSFSNSWVVLLL